MEAAAEIERHGLLAVPRANHDDALRRDAVDRLLESRGIAARVDGDIRAAPAGELANESPLARRDRGLRAAAFGERAAQRGRLDRDDARRRATQELRHEEADNALPEDRD